MFAACDDASESEVVIPLFDSKGDLVGVFDLDAPVKNGFDSEDRRGLTKICEILAKCCDWNFAGEVKDYSFASPKKKQRTR